MDGLLELLVGKDALDKSKQKRREPTAAEIEQKRIQQQRAEDQLAEEEAMHRHMLAEGRKVGRAPYPLLLRRARPLPPLPCCLPVSSPFSSPLPIQQKDGEVSG